jgi:hypothetical protein
MTNDSDFIQYLIEIMTNMGLVDIKIVNVFRK